MSLLLLQQHPHIINNKYLKWYSAIISQAIIKNRNKNLDNVYYENHHILPHSMGGTAFKLNLVLLTAREHFISHLLLTKFLINASLDSMLLAYNMLSNRLRNEGKIANSHLYESTKIKAIATLKKINTDRVMSKDTKKRMSDGTLGQSYYYSDEHNQTIRLKPNENIPVGFIKTRVKTGNFVGWDNINSYRYLYNIKTHTKDKLLKKSNEIMPWHIDNSRPDLTLCYEYRHSLIIGVSGLIAIFKQFSLSRRYFRKLSRQPLALLDAKLYKVITQGITKEHDKPTAAGFGFKFIGSCVDIDFLKYKKLYIGNNIYEL